MRFLRGFLGISSIQPVAEPAHAHKVARLRRIVLDLSPQCDDVAVDGAVGDEGLPAPRVLDQLIAAQDSPAVAHENSEELEFERRKFNGLSPAPQLGAPEVDFHLAESENIFLITLEPAQHRMVQEVSWSQIAELDIHS